MSDQASMLSLPLFVPSADRDSSEVPSSPTIFKDESVCTRIPLSWGTPDRTKVQDKVEVVRDEVKADEVTSTVAASDFAPYNTAARAESFLDELDDDEAGFIKRPLLPRLSEVDRYRQEQARKAVAKKIPPPVRDDNQGTYVLRSFKGKHPRIPPSGNKSMKSMLGYGMISPMPHGRDLRRDTSYEAIGLGWNSRGDLIGDIHDLDSDPDANSEDEEMDVDDNIEGDDGDDGEYCDNSSKCASKINADNEMDVDNKHEDQEQEVEEHEDQEQEIEEPEQSAGSDYDDGETSNISNNIPLKGISAPSGRLLPSRNSGFARHNHNVNRAPIDFKVKKGRPKRAHGVNNADNVFIVNSYENDNWSWAQIADHLNDERTATGRAPEFTANAVHNRYNRNAPLMFAAEGKDFIPINQRRKAGANARRSMLGNQIWTEDLDDILRDCVTVIDSARWSHVARLFNEHTGNDVDARAVATRHTSI